MISIAIPGPIAERGRVKTDAWRASSKETDSSVFREQVVAVGAASHSVMRTRPDQARDQREQRIANLCLTAECVTDDSQDDRA
jgi:hypothetical protein